MMNNRKRRDYCWLAFFFFVLVGAAEYFFPARSSPDDMAFILKSCNPLGLKGSIEMWLVWTLITIASLYLLTGILWLTMRWIDPVATPTTHFYSQSKAAGLNFFILGFVQTIWDWATSTTAISKTTSGNLDHLNCVRSAVLWMLCFELSWYTQHRLMHDVKFLWIHGHAYHHTWRHPEHMIGITNFAFDHVIEIWVSMSSSFLGYALFPTNFFWGKTISLAYMLFAILSHWDGFGFSRYHINHHYLVTKNFGAHIPIFDIFFGTYQWDAYEHPSSSRFFKRAITSEQHGTLRMKPTPASISKQAKALLHGDC